MNAILTVLISAQSDIQLKSYDSFTILGQIFIVKTAIFDQFYRHQKEWSYIDFKDLLGNGMARGTKWEQGEAAQVECPIELKSTRLRYRVSHNIGHP